MTVNVLIVEVTNEGTLAVDGPISKDAVPIFSGTGYKIPKPNPSEAYLTADGQSVPQFSDIIVSHATWSGRRWWINFFFFWHATLFPKVSCIGI